MHSSNRLLIIDDEHNMRRMLWTITSKAGYDVVLAKNGKEGMRLQKETPFNFVLCDLKMPHMDGLQFLQETQKSGISTTIIMMSAYAAIDDAVNAMKSGAYDFITKPFKTEAILLVLKKARERQLLLKENLQLKTKIKELQKEPASKNIVATAPAMRLLLDVSSRIAQYNSTVLITGESGTGKELFAQRIHQLSDRNANKFIAVNCGSIPENLLESEFFGYKKGAFTGANSSHRGLFENANDGTLFLDEIGELPLNLQVKLLRVLQENEVQPLGTHKTTKINVRIIAATAKNLSEEVANHAFRQDLFYRLNVIELEVPPLRERPEDIPVLCNHFIKKLKEKIGVSINNIAPAAMSALLQHEWPGNVRELENTIERSAILSEGDTISQVNLSPAYSKNQQLDSFFQSFSLKRNKKIFEKYLISKALKSTSCNKSSAAKLLELSYPSLLNKIKEYDL